MKILDLGCGNRVADPDAITLDIDPRVKPDVLHDLNCIPYPFSDNSFDLLYCNDVIEHVRDVVATMSEIHRIAKSNATLRLTTPHFSCFNSYKDPTHLHHLSFFTFDHFSEQFEKVSSTLVFDVNLKNKFVSRFANRFPLFYERHLTFIFPAWFMIFELKVKK